MYTDTFASPYPSHRCNYISNITLVKYNIGRNFDRISIINMKKKLVRRLLNFGTFLMTFSYFFVPKIFDKITGISFFNN